MMTERETINSLIEHKKWLQTPVIYGETLQKLIEALDIAIFDISLQTPTEPIVDEKTDNWTCPNCFDEYADIERHKFCPNCGQAIKHKEKI